MQQGIGAIALHVSLLIEAMAVIFIAFGSFQAFVWGLRVMLVASTPLREKREIWMRYARWLVGAMTFQLGADILQITVAPTWDEVGQLAVVACVRTMLTVFLDREMGLREARQRAGLGRAHAGRSFRPALPQFSGRRR